MKVSVGQHQVNIEISGNPAGPVVMMAHSLACNLHMWDPQMAALERDFNIIRLDMRGHGLSDAPAAPYTLEELADDVIAVMDKRGVEQAHWVGLSIGGMFGQSLLLRYPGRFLSATLCDTMSVFPDQALSVWEERIATVRANGLGSLRQATLDRWFTPGFLATRHPRIEAVGKQIDEASDEGYIGCGRAIIGLNYLGQLDSIKVPVLLIVGAQDSATPVAASEAMHERLPDSELVVIDDASHIANVEQVDAFNAALLPFLRRVARTSPG